MKKILPLALLALLTPQSAALAGGDSAPSSHMVYNDASFDGDILINEVRVPDDGVAMYTYYEALGWGGKAAGYAGIQEHPRARNFIFSIWDHKEHAAPIRAVHRGPGTETKKFGGEGTGLKSWNFELGWDTGVWYTLVARSWPVGDHTYYGFWARDGKTGEWTHLVTMDVAVAKAHLRGGNDSFIEDWLATGKDARTIHLRNGWKRRPDGEWHAFGTARYSVNSWDLVEGKRSFNFRTNWDGGVAKDETGEFYYMVSGGAGTKPTSENPSKHAIGRAEKKPGYAPAKVRSAKVAAVDGRKVTVEWEIDPQGAPPFAFSLAAFDRSKPGAKVSLGKDGKVVFGGAQPLVVERGIEPHLRKGVIELPAGLDLDQLELVLVCRDLFDNLVKAAVAGSPSR